MIVNSDNKKTFVNLSSALVLLALNLLYNFFLAPYVVETLGEEAYGYITLANNFAMYAGLITVAFNSMAGRFVSVEYHRGNMKSAQEYYSTIFYTNIFLSLIMILPMALLTLFLDKLINIPSYLIVDVKLIFGLVFLNFIINLVASVFSISTFVTNDLYRLSVKRLISVVVKVFGLWALFNAFGNKLYLVGLSIAVSSLYLLVSSWILSIKVFANIKITYKSFNIARVKDMFAAGVWNTITNIGNVLSDGLDLLVANLFISPTAMGIIAISKTLNTILGSLTGSVSESFQPLITRNYAIDKKDELIGKILLSMKVNGLFSSIAYSWIIIFSLGFFALWIPNLNSKELWILCILSLQGSILSGNMSSLFPVFTLTNKLKLNAISRVAIGLLSVFITYLIVKNTNYGIYAVAGVSSLLGSLFNFFFVPSYVSHLLDVPKWIFYKVILRHVITIIIVVAILFPFSKILVLSSWIMTLFSLILTTIIGLAVALLINFSYEDRKKVKSIVLRGKN